MTTKISGAHTTVRGYVLPLAIARSTMLLAASLLLVSSAAAGPDESRHGTEDTTLFAIDMYGATTSALFKIDRATASAKGVVEFVGSSAVMGIAFADDGTLYAADYVDLPTGSTIYTLDLKTGLLSPLFKTGVALVHNIAFTPQPADCVAGEGGVGDHPHGSDNQCN